MEHNPTLPLSFDIQATLIMLAYALLTVAALVSILRTHHDRAGSKFWWCALVIALPVVGAAAWFLLGSPTPRRREKLRQAPPSPPNTDTFDRPDSLNAEQQK